MTAADPLALAREHEIDLDTIPDDVVADAPEPVRPWARLLLALAERLAPYGVSHGAILADTRHGALTRALVDLGRRQENALRNLAREDARPAVLASEITFAGWPTLDPDTVELDATRAAVDNLLAVMHELDRLRTEAARVEAERAFRASLLDGVPGVLSNDPRLDRHRHAP